MPKRKRKDHFGEPSAKDVEDTTSPIIFDLEQAAIGTPLVKPALRQLASGGISTARPGREAFFDVLSTTVLTIERVLAASRTSAGRALGVRTPKPRPTPASGGADVAAAIAAANAAAAAATSAAMAAQSMATMMASMASGGAAGPAGAGVEAGAGGADPADGGGGPRFAAPGSVAAAAFPAPLLAAMPVAVRAAPPFVGAPVVSPFVRSRADLGTGRLPERRQIRPGAPVRVPLTVTNGTNQAQRRLELRSSDLISSRGDRIPSAAVTFDPPTLDLTSRGRAVVTATIDVPDKARRGSYTARVYGPNHQGVETILTFDVR